MDDRRFDAFTRSLATGLSRRKVLKGLLRGRRPWRCGRYRSGPGRRPVRGGQFLCNGACCPNANNCCGGTCCPSGQCRSIDVEMLQDPSHLPVAKDVAISRRKNAVTASVFPLGSVAPLFLIVPCENAVMGFASRSSAGLARCVSRVHASRPADRPAMLRIGGAVPYCADCCSCEQCESCWVCVAGLACQQGFLCNGECCGFQYNCCGNTTCCPSSQCNQTSGVCCSELEFACSLAIGCCDSATEKCCDGFCIRCRTLLPMPG